jgi:NtrC-family two-component system sensor histidine kinase KinB
VTARRRDREQLLALAHELRTPLTALQVGVGVLDGGALGPLTGAQHDLVVTLRDELGRLRRLVEASLDTARLGAYAGPILRESSDLVEVARAAVTPIAEQMAQRRISLTVSGRGPQPVVIDRLRLSWAIAALAGNALRYAPEDSVIAVHVRRRKGFAAVEVRDQGPGIPESVRTQLRKRGGGHALTLLMVRDIVEAHDGRLRVREHLPVGSAIELALPLAAESSMTPRSSP